MKRYILNNNTFCNTKKAKVACHCDGELNAKGCTTVPVFFDLNKISCKKVEDDIEQKKKLDRLYFFHIEENGKRRKINFLNFFNEFDGRDTPSRHCGASPSDAAPCPAPSTTQPISYSRGETGTIKVSSHTHVDHSSSPSKQEPNLLKSESPHFDTVEDEESCRNKKYNQIKNKYYEKINHLLKQVHMNQIARRNSSGSKGMHPCEDANAKQCV
ncbi:conserved Plasmodium protein, unknown function [Plasmodium vivax]|uniref:Uncharacterized protein n=5 Tax=Plasmodium vivax TaxID=5855 RepID=A5K1F1_PLAVS|nr:hypothetical protein, conserved [Plasmodium vivax]KMZ83945.1 hypothetical protein PVBG_01024 [Plasmodium vivax Brazil I]KMZ90781.1 hypothetical protein PVMG_02949 [Plasmodium vivax Mauritania I]KMZ97303.1 hypothetical protein PVNG_06087 [Plasmodium vivax North Korean]EDL47148.1 hypothetical protein, conserved [Plasmodium vivax]KMZ97466.1 hypothetical protein PVNG_01295 [Plasmodium vivax North Korean]|eukprot:XP_001616875.1 hypothetical protein [Plasmodium vivax Sal-1]